MFRALLAHHQEATQAALGILRACYVSRLHQGWSGTAKYGCLIENTARYLK
jgi:hypothetical protein